MNRSLNQSARFFDFHQTFRRLLSGYSDSRSIIFLYGLIFVLVVGASFWSPSFWTQANLVDILRSSIVVALVAIGEMIVVVCGGIDFSIGMIAVFVGVIAAKLFTSLSGNIPITVIAALAVGVLIGLANGLLVGINTSNAFIITFGSFFVLTGLVLVVSSAPVAGVPTSFLNLYDATVVGALPWCVVGMFVVWIAVWVLLGRTAFGRSLYAVGGSQRTATLAGIHVRGTILAAYALSGLFGAAAGLFILARSGLADVTGNGLEFTAIVAVAVGGVSLFGGVGSVVGVLGGVLLLTLISNLLIVGNVSEYYQQLVTGGIILLAVGIFRQGRRTT